MITITGRRPEDGAEGEDAAAQSLKRKILDFWPDIETSNEDNIQLIIEPRLDAGSVKSADVLIIADFKKPKEIKFQYPLRKFKRANQKKKGGEDPVKGIEIEVEKVFLKNFICSVEVKNSSKSNIEFRQGDLYVRYHEQDLWKNASAQNERQIWATQAHIKNHTRIEPFVTNLIYLNRIKKLDEKVYGVYTNDHSFYSMLASICGNMLRMSIHTKINHQNKSAILQCVSGQKMDIIAKTPFFYTGKPTEIDSKRMLRIAKKVNRDWFEDVGKKLLIFKGLGGTGKTVRLLQIAHELSQERETKTILFTYNWSLIANLRRLMGLMGIRHYSTKDKTGSIHLESVMSFISKILNIYGLVDENDNLLDVYEEKVNELSDYLTSGVLSESEFRQEMKKKLWDKYDEETNFDYAFIDEGQDWYEAEKNILITLFGLNKLVVAHGKLQETRTDGIEWSQGLTETEKKEKVQIRTLTAALRMTPNLGEFVKSFARRTLLDDQYIRLKINEQAEGGDIYIVEGDYFKEKDFHNFLMDQSIKSKAEPIDLLHCVPPDDLFRDADGYHSNVGKKLQGFGYSVWDAVDETTRKTSPKSNQDMRIVQYDSCRGLEGWITFLHQFDTFWNYKIEELKKDKGQKKLFEDNEDFINEGVSKWALIALTRSINSTVIQIDSRESHLGKILWELASENQDYLHWKTLK